MGKMLKMHTACRFVRALYGMELEPVLYGPKMKVSGIPAGMISFDGSPAPVIIKTGKCPGIWDLGR